jgi:glycosyltransferase involved in cell wall biosynthesis
MVPTVSVVIPNYNHARYLPQRIASVLNQTYADFEVLLLDDASTDNSVPVFTPLVENDTRVRVILNPTNSGSGYRQWNRGIREAVGRYIWIAESDDWADLRFLETLVGRLEADPGVGVAYCQSWRVDEAGKNLGEMRDWTDDLSPERWKSNFTANGTDECRRYLCQKNTILNASGVVFRRDLYEKIGGVPEHLRLCGDWLFWVRMLEISDLAFVAEPLNYFRLVDQSVTQKTKRDGTNAEESYRVAEYIAGSVGIDPSVREAVCEKMFYTWTHPVLRQGVSLPLRKHAAIYRRARLIDPGVGQRLRHRLAVHLVEKFPLLQRPARLLKRIQGRPVG